MNTELIPQSIIAMRLIPGDLIMWDGEFRPVTHVEDFTSDSVLVYIGETTDAQFHDMQSVTIAQRA